jgi:hypothetical protein
VTTVALDDHLADLDRPVALIKLDVQGAEGRALFGMRRLLARQRHVTLALEFWPYGLRRGGVDALAVLGLLQELDFRLHQVDEADRQLRRVEPGELLAAFDPAVDAFTNLLAVRSLPAEPDRG